MGKRILSKTDFVTINDISSYCMVSPSTVRRWIRAGKLQAIKLPSGHFRVTAQSLRSFFIENHIPIPEDLSNAD